MRPVFIAKPAYGRKYASPEEVMKDWHDEKDFYSQYGYFSKRDKDTIIKSYSNIVIQWAVGKEVVVR